MTRPLFVVTLSILAVGQTGLSGSLRADELFSRVPIDSVFVPSDPSPASRDTGVPPRSMDRGQKVLSIDQLADLLRDAGLEPQLEAEKVVSVQLQHARGTFSLALALTESRDDIELVLKLSDVADGQLSTDKLLALLAANREHQPAVFAYSQQRKRLELWRSIANFDITPRSLRDEMRRLTTIAESTASLWDMAGSAASPAPSPAAAPTAPSNTAATPSTPAQPAAPQATQQPATKTAASPLTGKWSAARSAKEAFAMLLKDDGSFVLVYVKDGKQTRSTGKFTLQGTQLTLSGSDGSKLAGTLSNVTGSSFEFTPQNSSAGKLTFQKAS